MKLKIYTLATDDNNGTHAAVFGTEAARDHALLDWVSSNREEWAESAFADDLHAYIQSRTDYLETFSTDEHQVEIDLTELMTVNSAWAFCKDNPGSFGNLYDPDEIMTILDGWAEEGGEEDASHWFDAGNAEDRLAILAWCEAEGPDFEDQISELVCSNLPNRGAAFAALEAKLQRERSVGQKLWQWDQNYSGIIPQN